MSGVRGLYEVTITDDNGCEDTCDRTLTVNANPSCTIDEPTEGGVLTGSKVGGSPDYTGSAEITEDGAGWVLERV